MKRGMTNFIRFLMDELLPPLVRDNKYFMFPFYLFAYRGHDIDKAMNFKSLVYDWSEREYIKFYNNLNTISRNRLTDLNDPCIEKILQEVAGSEKMIDVGCGNGFLLKKIHKKFPHINLYGCDIVYPKEYSDFYFEVINVENLPYTDHVFDTVVCTHTLEHCIRPKKVVEELLRIAKKKVIVVVPRQRYFYYTLDEHINFFYHKEQLTSLFSLHSYQCRNLRGDWFYVGDVN